MRLGAWVALGAVLVSTAASTPAPAPRPPLVHRFGYERPGASAYEQCRALSAWLDAARGKMPALRLGCWKGD